MKTPVYLDYNATTPVDPRVLEQMLPYFTEHFGNAHSKTHSYGWLAEDAVKTARAQVAQLINCDPMELVFTSGATEAVNLAIKGVYKSYHKKGKHIIALSTEHKAVLDCCEALKKEGAQITYLTVSREGLLDLQELKNALSNKTILVCAMLANNETGVIQNIEAISEIVHAAGALLLCDATQALGKMRVDVQEQGIDLMPFSAHKIYGPKGVGALYVRRKNPRVTLIACMDGGGHENGLRAGTLNVPGIVGLGAACELAENEQWEDAIHLSKLRTKLEQSLLDLGNVFVNGSQKNRLPNVSNLCLVGTKAQELISQLPKLAFSTGSACSSALPEPSHVLKAMGLDDESAYASIRLSLGKNSSEEEVNFAINSIVEVLSKR
jgi:cysteine desulfurase